MLFYVIGYTVLGLKVAAGLGFVIFVHELGHFTVAKLCGVKCEKFYLGFDFGGLKFCKFRYGETEYGIGIVPLGGYVKMLGQEDNPAKIREEMERAKEAKVGSVGGPGTSVPSEAEQKSEVRGQSSESSSPKTEIRNPKSDDSAPPSPVPLPPSAYDPRSFLAKSVPKRMAIISAGVIMNVIFAFVMAVVAVSPWMGVPTPPCVVGEVVSGKPAWQADLRPSDEILAIAGRNMRQFRDLQTAISLGSIDPKTGVQLTVRRPGVAAPFPVPVMPDHTIGAFFIGVSLPSTTTLVRDRKTWLVKRRFAAIPGSAADLARPAFRCGDRIVQIDDAPISDFGQIEAQLARTADRPIQVTVERAPKAPAGEPERLRIAVAPSPMRDLGLVMTMGEIAAVQKDSPAEAAGIKAGDLITHYDGHPVGDPMRLPDRLDRLAGKTVRLTVQRKGETGPIQISARLRQPIDLPPPLRIGAAVTVSSLGVAYRILNKVERVVDGGPAARSGLRAGDSIVRAKITPPSKEVLRKLEFDQSADVLPEQEGDDTWWPAMMAELQTGLPGTNVELRYVHPGSKEPITAELTPADAADWCNPERGFLFEPMTFDLRADSVGDAMMLGGRETLDALTLVYRTVGAISTTQVSLRMIAGPKTIVMVALESADQGTARLLLFLTLLSANLAVLNFLPIPLLDGGHFVLLCYEGIRGKPAPESVQIVLSYIGLTLVLALMVWALGLDFGVFARH